MPDRNAQIMNQIYSKLAESFAVGDSDASPMDGVLLLSNPGIFLDPTLDLSRASDRYRWSTVLNRVPVAEWIYQDSGRSLDSLYGQVLRFKELPTISLTDDERRELEDNRRYLTPSRMRNYDKYADLYYAALRAYKAELADARNQDREVDPTFAAKLNQARRRWITLGERDLVERAQARIANLEQKDPNTWWQELQERLELAGEQTTAGTHHHTGTFPEYQAFQGDEGWAKFAFNERDVTHQVTSTIVRAGFSGGASWGLWRASASHNYESDSRNEHSQLSDISIEMDVMRAAILRDWLEPIVLESRAWRWAEGSPVSERLLSDGTGVRRGATPPLGLLQVVPYGVLVTRNVVISASFSETDTSYAREKVESRASVGWGPFSVGGHYMRETARGYTHANVSGSAIAIPEPQILGWFCYVLPLSPNPDPTLPWPSRLSLEHYPAMHADTIREMVAARAQRA